jgi:hypothetical protein
MKRAFPTDRWVDVSGFAIGVLTEALMHLRARRPRLVAVPPVRPVAVVESAASTRSRAPRPRRARPGRPAGSRSRSKPDPSPPR